MTRTAMRRTAMVLSALLLALPGLGLAQTKRQTARPSETGIRFVQG